MTTFNFTYQTIVLDGTPAGVFAACGSALQGCRTALVAVPYPGFTKSHIGGMPANGLCATDGGRFYTHTLGSSLVDDLFRRNGGYYGARGRAFAFEPHVAEKLMMDMLDFYGVDVFPDLFLISAAVSAQAITSITCQPSGGADTYVFSATNYIDATYEGDLAAAAGVTMTVGRESNVHFTASPPSGVAWANAAESLAGFNVSSLFSLNNFATIDPFVSGGAGPLLPGASVYPALSPGDADNQVQSYGFRLCMQYQSTRLIRQPIGYDESLFEIKVRETNDNTQFGVAPTQQNKSDKNWDYWPYASDPTGGTNAWPTASYAGRAAIAQQIYKEMAGFLWWQQNSPDCPELLQQQALQYGLSSDEFTDNTVYQPGWSRYPYVREARRMVGQYVMAQTDIQNPAYAQTKIDPLCLCTYSVDCHVCGNWVPPSPLGFYVDSNNAVPFTDKQVPIPWQMPFRSVLPRTSEITNLGVVWAVSISHVAFCSFRTEISAMKVGLATGIAAGLASVASMPISSLPYGTLGPALIAAHIPLTYP